MCILQTNTNVRNSWASHWCSQDYISRIKILISNHHLSGPMKSYNDFFFHKDLFTIKKIPLIKFIIKFIVYDKLSIKKWTMTVPQSSFVFFLSSFFPPSLRYTITHSRNFNFYLRTTHLKKKNYFQFYASRKAVVITTNLSQL